MDDRGLYQDRISDFVVQQDTKCADLVPKHIAARSALDPDQGGGLDDIGCHRDIFER